MILIHKAYLINNREIKKASILIDNEIIIDIFENQVPEAILNSARIINAEELYVLPGIIDDQVHFREPGLTHKGDIETESMAAIAGGITSYLEMPNTNPPTITMHEIENKLEIASKKSFANYGFYLGATNTNYNEVCSADNSLIAGIKIFLGSSTGNMLVDNEDSLNYIFKNAKIPVAVHAEEESIIKANLEAARLQFGENIPVNQHPIIRNQEACYASSKKAFDRAIKFGTRLHILHLSTAKETELLKPCDISQKQITAEVCAHHLWFSDEDYSQKGNFIKWNPSIKSIQDRETLKQAVVENRIDIIATDHAPHTLEEKSKPYLSAPSGGPLVQHSLQVMLELFHNKEISLELLVEKMCHNPAILFGIKNRGFIKKGFFADLTIIDLKKPYTVSKDNILYKCNWSPFEGKTFKSSICYTIINGKIVFENGKINETKVSKALAYHR